MTTEEKLIALGFDQYPFAFKKEFVINDNILVIIFYQHRNVGVIRNYTKDFKECVKDFTELLRLNDFYEKQSRRSASRHTSRNDSETQNDIQRA